MKKNISMIRGDTFSFNFVINEEVVNAFFTAKKTTRKDDTNYIFKKSLGDGITLVDQDQGEYTYCVRVAPEDTFNVNEDTYYYDLQINVTDDVYTPLIGRLKITYDVTREV